MLFEEIKKIWSWKKCLCLLAFWILYFLLFISPYVSIYEGSYQQTADIAADIVKKYGNYISEDEYEKMKADAPQKGVSEIDKMIAENPLFQSYGFRTFQEFNYAEESLSPDEDTALWMEIYDVFTADDITREFTRTIELNVYQMYLDRYESEALGKADGTSYYKDLDEAQRQRTLERNWKEVYGILPPQVIGDNFEVLQFWAAFAIISVIFMILPYMVQENRNRMTMLQYSCKRGRKYYLYKLAACLLSAFLVIGAEFLFYMLIAKINRVIEFWNAPAASFSSGYIGWFPWTLGTLSLMNVLFCTMTAVGAGLILFVVTRYCRNHITAIAWALPLVILAGCYGAFLVYHFMEITTWKYLVPVAAGMVLGIGILAVGVQFVSERKRNID